MAFPVLHTKPAQKITVFVRRFFGKCLQIRLHLLINVFPLLLHLLILRLFPIFIFPVSVVVHTELFLQKPKFFLCQLPFCQKPAHSLCIEHVTGEFEFPVCLPPEQASGESDRSEVTSVYDVLHRDIAA